MCRSASLSSPRWTAPASPAWTRRTSRPWPHISRKSLTWASRSSCARAQKWTGWSSSRADSARSSASCIPACDRCSTSTRRRMGRRRTRLPWTRSRRTKSPEVGGPLAASVLAPASPPLGQASVVPQWTAGIPMVPQRTRRFGRDWRSSFHLGTAAAAPGLTPVPRMAGSEATVARPPPALRQRPHAAGRRPRLEGSTSATGLEVTLCTWTSWAQDGPLGRWRCSRGSPTSARWLPAHGPSCMSSRSTT
mmetsp:Transcript_88207/g.284893  ORF Transcript_88207/g.284893 Transcript_88207/m.284893 type:complete len:249 (+) Transcript_88207:260-1006(+)